MLETVSLSFWLHVPGSVTYDPQRVSCPLFHFPVRVLRLQLYTPAPGSMWVLEFLRLARWLQGCDLFPSLAGRTASGAAETPASVLRLKVKVTAEGD